jgi:xylulokinase
MEGVAYEMLVNLEWLKGSGIHFQMLHATGGGARSAVWTQMKADILNVPFTTLATANAGTVGSAMLTGIAVGCFQNLDEAAVHMVEKTKVYLPDEVRHEKYMEVYRRYRRVYDAVRGLM